MDDPCIAIEGLRLAEGTTGVQFIVRNLNGLVHLFEEHSFLMYSTSFILVRYVHSWTMIHSEYSWIEEQTSPLRASTNENTECECTDHPGKQYWTAQ